jgi:hypothetical protein
MLCLVCLYSLAWMVCIHSITCPAITLKYVIPDPCQSRHDFCQASRSRLPILSCSSSSRRHSTCPAHLHPHPPPHLIAGLLLRTGVTLSPHLSLCAPPLPAHSQSRLDIAPAHKEGLEATHRLIRTHRNRPLQLWSPKEKPPILSVATIRAHCPGLCHHHCHCHCHCNSSRAPTHSNRSSNVFFLNSASTSATSRAMVRLYELFRYGFRFSTYLSPALAPSRTTGHAGAACPGIVDVDMAGLTSLIPSPPISAHRRLVSV